MSENKQDKRTRIYQTGQKIGNCIYLHESHKCEKWRTRYVVFKCECGNEFVASLAKVKTGETSSCGCYKKMVLTKNHTTHGLSRSCESRIWRSMIQRCTNKNEKSYKRYGAIGIKVCDRWLNSFINFYNDMGPRPSAFHTLDRYPNNKGNYEPSNCRWATIREQALNRKSNVLIEYKGDIKTLIEWAELLKLPYAKIRVRIKQLNWSPTKAFETPC